MGPCVSRHRKETAHNTNGAAMPAATINAVYYPSWGVYRDKPPSSLQVEAVTHVFYAFVGVHEDGTLKWIDEWADVQKPADGQQGCLAALAELKRKHPRLKTLVSLGGGNSSAEFPALAASETARQTLAREVRAFCDRHAFDGVDVDWEHPSTAEQGEDFVELIRVLREALPCPGYLVTAALPVGEYCLKNINLAEACGMMDFLNLMSYDFTGAWTSVCGHHSQLWASTDKTGLLHADLRKSGSRGVEYVQSRGVPSRKIVLGVPVYARFFPNARGPGQPFGSEAGEMNYSDLPGEWVTEAQVDDVVAAASVVDLQGGKGFVSFDVPRTVAVKAEYVRARGLGGLFYWTGIGDRPGPESLVLTGYSGLGLSNSQV